MLWIPDIGTVVTSRKLRYEIIEIRMFSKRTSEGTYVETGEVEIRVFDKDGNIGKENVKIKVQCISDETTAMRQATKN